MNDAADRPRLVLLRPVYIAFGGVDNAVSLLGPAGLSHAAASLAEKRNPFAVDKVVDDDDAVLAESLQTSLGGAFAGPLRAGSL